MLRTRISRELAPVETALLRELVFASSGLLEPGALPASGSVDWARLLDAAERHRLGPLVAQGALQALSALRPAPLSALERMQNTLNRELARAVVRLHHVDELGAAAYRQGLDACLLKGVAFATTLYRNPALRPMADVDILVRDSEFDRWSGVLESMGYIPFDRSDHALCFRRRQSGIYLELHREICSQASLLGIATDALLERSVPFSTGEGVRLLTLSWEDHLLHLALHASFQHGFRQPGANAWDARCIAERGDFDGNRFFDQSRDPRLAPWVFGGLAMSEAVFPGTRLRALRMRLESELPRRVVRKARRFRAERLLAPDLDAVFGPPFERLAWTGPSLQSLRVLLDLSRPRTSEIWGRPHRIMQLFRSHGVGALRAAISSRRVLQMSPTPASLEEVRDV